MRRSAYRLPIARSSRSKSIDWNGWEADASPTSRTTEGPGLAYIFEIVLGHAASTPIVTHHEIGAELQGCESRSGSIEKVGVRIFVRNVPAGG